jgi:hypothetical protein
MTATPGDLIAEYLWLRDNKKAEKEKFDAWLAENYTKRMDEIEGLLLAKFDQDKTDSITAHGIGNAHRKVSTSVTIADMREFKRHVIGSEAWELVDWRANKTAVGEIVEAKQPLPPGVNYTETYTVGVRKG